MEILEIFLSYFLNGFFCLLCSLNMIKINSNIKGNVRLFVIVYVFKM